MGDVLFMEISMACYDCIPLRIPNILFTPFTHPANFLVFNIPPPVSMHTYTLTMSGSIFIYRNMSPFSGLMYIRTISLI